MAEPFDGIIFNRGMILTALVVLLLFGTVYRGNDAPESEPQETTA